MFLKELKNWCWIYYLNVNEMFKSFCDFVCCIYRCIFTNCVYNHFINVTWCQVAYVSVCLLVCLLPNSSKMAPSNELEVWVMILLGIQILYGYKNRMRTTVRRKTEKSVTTLTTLVGSRGRFLMDFLMHI